MLSNLIYSLNAVVPIVILCLIGVFLKRINLINDSFTAVSEKMVFKVALPVMLFLEVSGCSLSETLDIRLILFCVVSVTSMFLVTALLSRAFIKDQAKCGAFTQGACRSNIAILGVPLADNLFGASGVATVALIMPFAIIMFNVYSVIVLSVFSGNRDIRLDRKAILGIVRNIVTNPLIIGVVLAIPFMLWQIELPIIVNKSLEYLKSLTTPLALICLGANFKRESMKGRAGLAVTAGVLRTVVWPLIMVTLAVLSGLRAEALGSVLILFGAPTAVASYIMAKNMGNDHELAGQILLLTTAMCAFTIFIGIFILKNFNLI